MLLFVFGNLCMCMCRVAFGGNALLFFVPSAVGLLLINLMLWWGFIRLVKLYYTMEKAFYLQDKSACPTNIWGNNYFFCLNAYMIFSQYGRTIPYISISRKKLEHINEERKKRLSAIDCEKADELFFFEEFLCFVTFLQITLTFATFVFMGILSSIIMVAIMCIFLIGFVAQGYYTVLRLWNSSRLTG